MPTTDRSIIIADTHWGVRGDNDVFVDQSVRFHREVLFPYMDQHNINHIIHAGDLMDRRKNVNFKTLQACRESFIAPIVERGISLDIIPGNHDAYYRNTNSVNAIHELLSGYVGSGLIRVGDKPFVTDRIRSRKVGVVPWITADNADDCSSFIRDSGCEFLVGHFELNGFRMSGNAVCDHGMDPSVLSRIECVFSGHFHEPQSSGNVWYVGAPYQMDFGDASHPRGFLDVRWDMGRDGVTFVENPFRMFASFRIPKEDPLDSDLRGRFVKLRVGPGMDPNEVSTMAGRVVDAGARSVVVDELDSSPSAVQSTGPTVGGTLDVLIDYVGTVPGIDDPGRVRSIIRELYEECR